MLCTTSANGVNVFFCGSERLATQGLDCWRGGLVTVFFLFCFVLFSFLIA